MCESSNETTSSHDNQILHSVASIILALFGTCGNALSVYLICKARLYRTAPTMLLIVDLCLANMISTVFTLPCIAVNSFSDGWLYGEVFCQVFAYIMYVSITTECIILIHVTFVQYLIIVHRVTNNQILHQNRTCHLFLLMGMPWIAMMAVNAVPLTKAWDRFDYDHMRGYCALINTGERASFQATLALSILAIMTITIFYSYSAIFYVHLKSRKKTTSSVAEAAARFKGQTRNAQLIKMISVVIGNYILTYIPYMVVSAIDTCGHKISPQAYLIVVYISWTHVATNPIIYALMNPKINKLWLDTFNCLRNKSDDVSPKTDGPATTVIDHIKDRNVVIDAETEA